MLNGDNFQRHSCCAAEQSSAAAVAAGSKAVRKTHAAVRLAILQFIHVTVGLPSSYYSSRVESITYSNEPIDLDELKANCCH